MKFTDSPVIELTVNGKQLSIQQDNATMHVGTSVWPCSLILSKFAERWSTVDSSSSPNPYAELLDFRRRRAVELGTGCGVAGMAFYLLGLTDIVLTDIAPVMPALKHNLKRNKAALGKLLKSSVVCWKSREQISALNPPFDLVIAADVVYIEESVGHLVTAMESLMADDGAVLLGYQIRSPEADKLFWELCDAVFKMEKVPHEHLHPEYAYEETDVYIFRKKAKKIQILEDSHLKKDETMSVREITSIIKNLPLDPQIKKVQKIEREIRQSCSSEGKPEDKREGRGFDYLVHGLQLSHEAVALTKPYSEEKSDEGGLANVLNLLREVHCGFFRVAGREVAAKKNRLQNLSNERLANMIGVCCEGKR